MSRYWSKPVHDLEPYVPGEQPGGGDWIKLNTNENPFGPSPRALSAIAEAAGDSLRLYPDPGNTLFRQAVAGHCDVEVEQVFAGNGSDEVLAHAFMAFFRQPRPILFPDITYSFYRVYCGLYGIEYRTPELDESLRLRLEDYPADNGGIIFPNPNAPTGLLLPLEAIRELLERNRDSVVVVDEAYIDFGGESAVALVPEFENLLVVQTLSKSRSLAGLRVGFAVGQRPLIEGLERIRDSFNSYPLDRLAEAGAAAAMADREYFAQCRQAVMEQREWLRGRLDALGFEVPPSAANFLFARHPDHSGESLAEALREKAILVRHFSRPERIRDFLRITLGTPEQNRALVSALEAIVK